MASSGTTANQQGKALESFVRQSLLNSGYSEVEAGKERLVSQVSSHKGRRFAAQAPLGETIYKAERTVDFLVSNPNLFPRGLVIECKWQQSSGSVDEKFPFTVLCIQKSKIPTLVVLDGGGYKPGALAWLQAQASRRGPLRAVWSMAEFQKAVNNGLFERRPLVASAKRRRRSGR